MADKRAKEPPSPLCKGEHWEWGESEGRTSEPGNPLAPFARGSTGSGARASYSAVEEKEEAAKHHAFRSVSKVN